MRFIPMLLIGACVIAAPARGQVPEPPVIPTAAEHERAAAESPPEQPDVKEGAAEQAPTVTGDQVTERVDGDQIITEYRRRGQLYMVKVKPKNGPAQYWVDRDGDGQLQPGDTEISEDINLPKWRIGNW